MIKTIITIIIFSFDEHANYDDDNDVNDNNDDIDDNCSNE